MLLKSMQSKGILRFGICVYSKTLTVQSCAEVLSSKPIDISGLRVEQAHIGLHEWMRSYKFKTQKRRNKAFWVLFSCFFCPFYFISACPSLLPFLRLLTQLGPLVQAQGWVWGVYIHFLSLCITLIPRSYFSQLPLCHFFATHFPCTLKITALSSPWKVHVLFSPSFPVTATLFPRFTRPSVYTRRHKARKHKYHITRETRAAIQVAATNQRCIFLHTICDKAHGQPMATAQKLCSHI